LPTPCSGGGGGGGGGDGKVYSVMVPSTIDMYLPTVMNSIIKKHNQQ
jgi:hypothetical protein